MGLFDWLWSWFASPPSAGRSPPAGEPPATGSAQRLRPRRRAARLTPRQSSFIPRAPIVAGIAASPPYRFAQRASAEAELWLDLSLDGRNERLHQFGLPVLSTPDDLARWLQISVGELAWLAGRFRAEQAPLTPRQAHYHFRWIPKRRGGRRLIEAPKVRLRQIQDQILRGILDRVPAHQAAHGFVAGRSHRSNAALHVGQNVLLKLDLQNFYPSVTYPRVVAIFRSLGFTREVAVWLGRLTTTRTPGDVLKQELSQARFDYRRRHLPQGAPTSPALANLSAFLLDLRLSGLARTFEATYTRYADDLTFSGPDRFRRSLAVFLPLVRRIIAQERFTLHPGKLRVERTHQRQLVTGVVVNSFPNVRRDEFDRLKAILTNCVRQGPSSQNRNSHENFPAHLRGRIAHVQALNPARGARLLALFAQIDWQR